MAPASCSLGALVIWPVNIAWWSWSPVFEIIVSYGFCYLILFVELVKSCLVVSKLLLDHCIIRALKDFRCSVASCNLTSVENRLENIFHHHFLFSVYSSSLLPSDLEITLFLSMCTNRQYREYGNSDCNSIVSVICIWCMLNEIWDERQGYTTYM